MILPVPSISSRSGFRARRLGCRIPLAFPRFAALVSMLVLGVSSAEPAIASGAERSWRPVTAGARPAEPLIAAAVSDRHGFATASGGSVRWWSVDGGPIERAALDDVRDLAFGPDGALWIGSATGLFRWAPGGRPVRRPLRGDAGAGDVRRLVGDAAGLLVATAAGAYWSTHGRVFQPLSGARVAALVEQVAFARVSAPGAVDRRRVWFFGAAGLERLEGLASASGLRIVRRARPSLPRPRSEARPVDLALSPEGTRLVVLYPDGLRIADTRAEPLAWRALRPVLA
ncbi:MAG: hypothetical protein AAGC67_18990, partial [Myxococcota bacterium]